MRQPTTCFHTARRRRGFMLVEVLVAMTILAVGFTGLLYAMTQSLDRSTLTKEYSTAMFLARHAMFELERKYAFTDDAPGDDRGEFYNEGLPEYSWETEAELDEDLEQYVLTVHILWDHKGRETRYTVRQLVPAHHESMEELLR